MMPSPSLALARWLLASAALALLTACATSGPAADHAAAVEAVRQAETGFAKTMADRDFDAFMAYISEEAVFANNGKPLVGKQAIGASWRRFYQEREAPFSWKPELVLVLASGKLAETGGPVTSPEGRVFAHFRSTWRLDADGRWRIVFDNGSAACDCNRTGAKHD